MKTKTIEVVCYCVTYASFVELELYTETHIYDDKQSALQAFSKHVDEVERDSDRDLTKSEEKSGDNMDPDYAVKFEDEYNCEETYLITLTKQRISKTIAIE